MSHFAEGEHFIGYFPDRFNNIELTSTALHDLILSPLEISETQIVAKGHEKKPGINAEAAFKEGMFLVQVDFKEASKLIHKYGGLVLVHNGSKGNGMDEEMKHQGEGTGNVESLYDSLGTLKEELFKEQYIDICEIRKEKDSEEFYFEKFSKPSIIASDAHEKAEVGNKFVWIKADPTFDGLKQIVYEPEIGERVKIGPVEPDQKDAYKVISKIQFSNTDDFPEEIVFNKNLCSIIGSRSSGKSALLAYVAHSVDTEATELVTKGPGEGDDYHWSKIKASGLECKVVWDNEQSNTESPGRVIYIPQNYLFRESENPGRIKERIKPLLFKHLPDFEVKFTQLENNITVINKNITEQVSNWFELSDTAFSDTENLKNLGNKQAIEKEKEEAKSNIEKLKEKNALSEEELNEYQEISSAILACETKIENISTELLQLSDVSAEDLYFGETKITLSPALANLPQKLQDVITERLRETEVDLLAKVNSQVIEYKNTLEKDKIATEDEKKRIHEENRVIIEKYQENIELEKLIKKINEYDEILESIGKIEEANAKTQAKLAVCVETIKSDIGERLSAIQDLNMSIENTDQSALGGIKFGVEYGFGSDLQEIARKINTKEKSEFIEKGEINIDDIRKDPGNFLSAIYSGKQKLISGNTGENVSCDLFSLTEKVLFFATMEDDKIGGFSESTMTPGKRALFALRLILAESDETWPLLIDQPEDDLDSRSIFDDVVPFLKEKKKDRQIIMVSHNANLVIGSDSEQVIVANRDGTDRKNADDKQFNYFTGSLEHSKTWDSSCADTLQSQGIREHSCLILDGGELAFEKRKNKYNL